MNSKFPQTVSLVDGKLAPNPEGKAGKKEFLSVRNPHGSGIRKGSGKQDRKKVSPHAHSSSRLQEYGGTCGRRLRVENYDVTSDKLQRKEFSFNFLFFPLSFPVLHTFRAEGNDARVQMKIRASLSRKEIKMEDSHHYGRGKWKEAKRKKGR